MRDKKKKLSLLITRPEEKLSHFPQKLRDLGFSPVILPLTQIVPPKSFRLMDEALKKWDSFDFVIFTSSLAVRFFLERAQSLKIRLHQPRILYAIGAQTAKTLKTAGFRKIKLPIESRAEGLLRELRHVSGNKILIPRAKEAREILPQTLKKRGAQVYVPVVYQVWPHKKSLSKLKRMSRKNFDAVIFSSGRAVKEFIKAYGLLKSRRLFLEIPAICIGGVTLEELKSYGINGFRSRTPDDEGLIKIIQKVLSQGRR